MLTQDSGLIDPMGERDHLSDVVHGDAVEDGPGDGDNDEAVAADLVVVEV